MRDCCCCCCCCYVNVELILIKAKREKLMEHHDNFREFLLLEPRGYPCQNANIVYPTSLEGASYGFVILEQNKIYPAMSG